MRPKSEKRAYHRGSEEDLGQQQPQERDPAAPHLRVFLGHHSQEHINTILHHERGRGGGLSLLNRAAAIMGMQEQQCGGKGKE